MTIDKKLELVSNLVNRAVTLMLEVTRDVQAEAGKCGDDYPRIALIQQVVADHYKIHPHSMTAKLRTEAVALARQVAMTLTSEFTRHTLSEIGHAFGGRTHGSVAHAKSAIDNRRATDRHFAAEFQTIRLKVAATLNLKLDEPVSTI